MSFQKLRKRVKQGFSFYKLSDENVLEVWDALWKSTPYGDVLFAAIEFYKPIVLKNVNQDIWSVVCNWSERVDNWCHSDGLSSVYSRLLENEFEEVYPQIVIWNNSGNEWLRRISLVSLIHYTGKNSVFLPYKKMFPLVKNCIEDQRYYVQTAVGWVLREMWNKYPDEVTEFIETYSGKMSTHSFSKATEKLNNNERNRLREKRKNS